MGFCWALPLGPCKAFVGPFPKGSSLEPLLGPNLRPWGACVAFLKATSLNSKQNPFAYIYIDIRIYRERARKKEKKKEREREAMGTIYVSNHSSLVCQTAAPLRVYYASVVVHYGLLQSVAAYYSLIMVHYTLLRPHRSPLQFGMAWHDIGYQGCTNLERLSLR